MHNKKVTLVLLAAVVLGVFAGCAPEVEKRQAAKLRWEKQTAVAKIPVAEDLLKNDQVDAASAVIDECLASLESNARAHLVKGKILFLKGKTKKADESFKLAIKYDPEFDEAWFWRGMLQQQNRDTKLAMESYTTAMELEPSKVEYVVAVSDIYASQGDYENATDLLQQKSSLMPFQEDIKIALADIKLRSGNIGEAIEIYKRVLLTSPNNTDVIAALAYCYVIDSRLQEASETFEKLLQKAEGNQKDAYLEMLAAISLNSDQFGKAVGYYDSLAVIKRDDADIWLKMGQAALGANAPKRALACAQRAISIRSGWADAFALRGCAQYLNEDYTESLSTFERIRGDKDFSCFAWLMTGRCLRKIGEHEMASAAFKKAAILDPTNELLAFVNN